MIDIERIDQETDHFIFRADEPARIEVSMVDGNIIAHAYKGATNDQDQEPGLIYDGTVIGATGTTTHPQRGIDNLDLEEVRYIAMTLISEDGENEEYDRALGELLAELAGEPLGMGAPQRIVEAMREEVEAMREERERHERARMGVRISSLIEELENTGGSPECMMKALELWQSCKGAGYDDLKEEIERQVYGLHGDPRDYSEAYVFVKGNLSEGYTIVGPYPDMDEAASAHDLEEGWLMALESPKT